MTRIFILSLLRWQPRIPAGSYKSNNFYSSSSLWWIKRTEYLIIKYLLILWNDLRERYGCTKSCTLQELLINMVTLQELIICEVGTRYHYCDESIIICDIWYHYMWCWYQEMWHKIKVLTNVMLGIIICDVRYHHMWYWYQVP